MALDILLAVLLGICAGIFTGLTPGVHINMVAVSVLAVSGSIRIDPLFLSAAIVAMSITHTFLDFVPSVFLGAPDPDTALAALPGHRMLLKGRAYEAIKLTAVGGVCSLAITILALPLLIYSAPLIYGALKSHLASVLSLFVLLLILKEREMKRRALALLVFLLSGALGMVVWDSELRQPLFQMLSGLFGISLLLLSVRSRPFIPEQRLDSRIRLPKRAIFSSSFLAFLSGSLVSIFPGLGPAQAAALVSVKKLRASAYMVTIGGINTVSMLFALVTTLTIDKARNGSIAVVQQIVDFDLPVFLFFVAVAAVSAAASYFLVLKVARLASGTLMRLNYSWLCISVIFFLFSLSFYFDGPAGIAVLCSAAFIGLLPSLFRVHRGHLMGCLLLPVIIYFV